jgi:outer membrane protein assembly factor BamE
MCFLSRILMLVLLGLSCVTLTACHFPPRIYRMDIRQGNLLTEEMICKLKKGMSKEQVRDILGSPALTHTLDKNRWDYYYYLKPGSGDPIIEKHFTVYFNNEKLVNWEGM